MIKECCKILVGDDLKEGKESKESTQNSNGSVKRYEIATKKDQGASNQNLRCKGHKNQLRINYIFTF